MLKKSIIISVGIIVIIFGVLVWRSTLQKANWEKMVREADVSREADIATKADPTGQSQKLVTTVVQGKINEIGQNFITLADDSSLKININPTSYVYSLDKDGVIVEDKASDLKVGAEVAVEYNKENKNSLALKIIK